jgi:transposase
VVGAPERQEPQGAPAEEPQLPQNNDHNNDHREEENNEEEEEEGNKVEGEEDENYTPWSNTEKDETFHDANEIKTFGNETPILTGRLKGLLNCINITTPPEFRIKRIPRPGREEYNSIMEIISGPNVLSRHKGPAFRTTYQNAVADTAWQTITTYSHRYHDELRNTVYHLLPQRKKNKFRALGSRQMFPGCLWCMTRMCSWRQAPVCRLPSRRFRNSAASSETRMQPLERTREW